MKKILIDINSLQNTKSKICLTKNIKPSSLRGMNLIKKKEDPNKSNRNIAINTTKNNSKEKSISITNTHKNKKIMNEVKNNLFKKSPQFNQKKTPNQSIMQIWNKLNQNKKNITLNEYSRNNTKSKNSKNKDKKPSINLHTLINPNLSTDYMEIKNKKNFSLKKEKSKNDKFITNIYNYNYSTYLINNKLNNKSVSNRNIRNNYLSFNNSKADALKSKEKSVNKSIKKKSIKTNRNTPYNNFINSSLLNKVSLPSGKKKSIKDPVNPLKIKLNKQSNKNNCNFAYNNYIGNIQLKKKKGLNKTSNSKYICNPKNIGIKLYDTLTQPLKSFITSNTNNTEIQVNNKQNKNDTQYVNTEYTIQNYFAKDDYHSKSLKSSNANVKMNNSTHNPILVKKETKDYKQSNEDLKNILNTDNDFKNNLLDKIVIDLNEENKINDTQDEDDDSSGALTYNQVKDIIINFAKDDKFISSNKTNYLFNKNDYDNFIKKKSLFYNFFGFNKSDIQTNILKENLLDNYPGSPSTKGSSKNKNNHVNLIKI